MVDTDYNGESFFVRHCYFLGGNDPLKRLKTEPGGVIVLEPAVVMSAAQARLNASPELLAQVTDAIAHPERAVPRRRRS
jgi:adenine-specific DNA-methyltransferase